MKILETISYAGDRFGILVNHILAIQPYNIKYRDNEEYNGCTIIMQDQSPDGTTFIARESYDTIRIKLEAME